MERTIELQGPFRLATALNVLNRAERSPQPSNHPALFHFSLEVPGGAVEVRVEQGEPGADLQLQLFGHLVDDEVADFIQKRVARMFSLQVNASAFFDLVRLDPHLRGLLTICPDLRPVLYPTPFEGVITALLSQRTSTREAMSLLNNLREVCGVVPHGCPQAPPAFPGKFTLLAVPDKLLEITGLPIPKVRAIKNMVAMLVGEPDLLEYLERVSDVERAAELLETLPGVDRHVALHLLQYAYGYPDLLLDSLLLRRAVQRFYHLSELPDLQTMVRLSEPYERWRSWWSFMLITANETSVIV